MTVRVGHAASGEDASVQLFISHAGTDRFVAAAVKHCLEELPSVHCYVLMDDIPAGDDWEARIRWAARECDAVVCIVTPEYIDRPWLYAEWAAFWFQETKPWFLLLLDTSLDKVFEIMTRRQSTVLTDPASVANLLKSLAPDTADDRLKGLADQVLSEVSGGRRRDAEARAEADLLRMARYMQSGSGNVPSNVVERLVSLGRQDDLIAVARDPQSDSATKRRQLAAVLVRLGEADAASQFDGMISNHSERRTIGLQCLKRLEQHRDAAALALLLKIYRELREPQRRDLRNAAEHSGLDIEWPT